MDDCKNKWKTKTSLSQNLNSKRTANDRSTVRSSWMTRRNEWKIKLKSHLRETLSGVLWSVDPPIGRLKARLPHDPIHAIHQAIPGEDIPVIPVY